MNASRTKPPGPKKDRDRPKSTEKPRGKNKERGTPENKPTTPGLEDERNGDSNSSVLNDDEIQSLAIKQDALNQIRASITADMMPQAPKDSKPVTVRKINRNPPPPRITKNIKVAKGAPPRAPLRPVETEGNSGPIFDGNGNVIAHSILGTLEEFKVAAENKGELTVDYYIRDQDRVQTPTILPEKYRKSVLIKGETTTQPVCENVEESNALLHWQNKMCERKLQQGHISRLLGKPEEDLVMNQVDKYRKKQELRYLIDRSIPAVDYGKGYRVGSEFWQQRHLVGDEDSGLHMTMSQTQQGYPPPIEHVDIPASIRKEKGLSSNRPKSGMQNKPWHRSSFLSERISELKPVMQDLDPHKPASDGLEIIGTNNPYERYIRAATPASEKLVTPSIPEVGDENQDPLSNLPDVYTPPMFGPAIKFAGELLQWTGDSYGSLDTTAVDARVTFEAHAGCRSTSILEIINLGTTAMYFSWKMLPKSNPFDLVNANVQRFYFNTSSGVILPGQTLNFPFVFKSDKAGVFGEQWQFQTHPVIAGGAALVVTLRGVAIKEDKLQKQRELIESKLQKNIIWKKMRRLIDEIVDSIKSPERPKSPVDSYLTEEEVFQRQNPQLHYKHHVVKKLKELYKMLVNPPTMDGDEDGGNRNDDEEVVMWNLNVVEFKKAVLELSDEDERKTYFLETINESVVQLSFHHVTPRLRKMYKACYQTFSNTVDNMIGHSMQIRSLLGLPEREQEDKLDESVRGKAAVPKVTPKTGNKEEKKSGKAEPKKEAKGKEAAKKNDRASPVKKTPPSRAAASLTNAGAEGRITPSTIVEPANQANVGIDPKQEKKYKEKMTAQAYAEMEKMMSNLEQIFEEIGLSDHATIPT
ncbi:MYCBP-associated protein-like [Watersipora subatra]|uniref:MYCBP-associated protein-like n=1 Tax=Watersipora subatra TaxID=2589382 RepID=UPI00355AEE44